MSNIVVKNLPWIAPTAAILVVGFAFLGRFDAMFEGVDPAVGATQTDPTGQIDPAIAALQAVENTSGMLANATSAGSTNAADQLSALLAAPANNDADVTRAQGFSIDVLEQTTDAAIAATSPEVASQEPVTQVSSDQISADFFSAAQANLERDTRCIQELRTLSSQAKVYFPSGGLTGEQTGISQARVLGLLARQCAGVTIEVSGHSDPSGDPEINRRLSLERAQAVITRVAASGVDASLFVAVGRGSDVPSNTTGPQDDAYYDRRVEFAVIETALQDVAFSVSGTGLAQTAASACVIELESAVAGASIEYPSNGMTISDADLARASALATLASNCPQARLRIMGQHDDSVMSGEDAATGRLRAIILQTTLVNAGFPSEQLIMGAPSDPRPIAGLSNSRVDFDFIAE